MGGLVIFLLPGLWACVIFGRYEWVPCLWVWMFCGLLVLLFAVYEAVLYRAEAFSYIIGEVLSVFPFLW